MAKFTRIWNKHSRKLPPDPTVCPWVSEDAQSPHSSSVIFMYQHCLKHLFPLIVSVDEN